MAHQGAEDALMQQALLGGDGDLLAQLRALALVGAVHGAVADGQRVHLGLLDELHRVQRVGVGGTGAEHMVLHTGQHAQLSLHRNAPLVGVFYHLAGELDVLFKGQGRAVDHHAGVAAGNGCLAGVEVPAVVQMQSHGDGAVLTVFLHRIADVLRAHLFVLQGGVHEIGTPAHKAVGQVRALQNGGAAEHLVHLDGGLGLGHGVHVERALGVVFFFSGFQNRAQRY